MPQSHFTVSQVLCASLSSRYLLPSSIHITDHHLFLSKMERKQQQGKRIVYSSNVLLHHSIAFPLSTTFFLHELQPAALADLH